MPRPSKGTDVHIYNSLDYIIPTLCRLHIHPNVITSISVLKNVKLFYVLKNPSQYSIFILFISHAILDCLDGELARQCNKTSDFGAHLDAFADHMFLAIVTAFMLSHVSRIRYDIPSVVICFFLISLWTVYGLDFNPTTHQIKGGIPEFIITNTVLLTVLLYFFFISFFNI